MIIAISGKIGSGKDAVGQIIQYLSTNPSGNQFHKNTITFKDFCEGNWSSQRKNCKWEIKKFAGKLKQVVSILTGIPIEDLEKQEVKNSYLGKEWTRYYWYHYKLVNSTSDGRISPYFNSREEAMSYEFPKIGHITSKWAKNIEGVSIKEELLTVRQLLQQVGTNLFRNQLHKDTWINALFTDYKLLPDASIRVNEWIGRTDFTQKEAFEHMYPSGHIYPKWIITDVRFPNELQAIKDRGGIVIRVNRYPYHLKIGDVIKPLYSNEEITINSIEHKVVDKVANPSERCIINGLYWYYSDIELVNSHPSETALDNAEFDYAIDNNSDIESLIVKVKEILIKEQII